MGRKKEDISKSTIICYLKIPNLSLLEFFSAFLVSTGNPSSPLRAGTERSRRLVPFAVPVRAGVKQRPARQCLPPCYLVLLPAGPQQLAAVVRSSSDDEDDDNYCGSTSTLTTPATSVSTSPCAMSPWTQLPGSAPLASSWTRRRRRPIGTGPVSSAHSSRSTATSTPSRRWGPAVHRHELVERVGVA